MRERFAKVLSHSGESRNPEFAATKTFWIPGKAGMMVVDRGLVINARISSWPMSQSEGTMTTRPDVKRMEIEIIYCWD